MVNRLLCSILLFFFLIPFITAQKQNHRFAIGPSSQILIGGEADASFDIVAGIEGYYLFRSSHTIRPYLNLSLSTDFQEIDATLWVARIEGGAQWHFHPKLSLFAGLGSYYTSETHRFHLIDEVKEWQNTSTSLSAKLGCSYSLTPHLHLKVSGQHLLSFYSALTIEFNYSF